jgi:hypothetical protein
MTAFTETPGTLSDSSLLGALLLVVPLLLAGELIKHPPSPSSLPDKESYRGNHSDIVIDSSKWREPSPESSPWRQPASPQMEWRTPSTEKDTAPSKDKKIKLFPKYQPRDPANFDFTNREDRSMMKVLEF